MNLFARSLLSYWLTTLLTLGLAAILLISTGARTDEQSREIPLERLEACARTLLDGRPASTGDLSLPAPSCPVRYLFGPDGKQLLGDRLPFEIAHLLKRQSWDGATPLVQINPGGTTIAFQIVAGRGAYQAVAILPGPPHGVPFAFWLHLGTSVAVSGLVFWLLARQFSRPIRSLQRVVEGVASGDLSRRPEGSLLRRNDELGELSRSIDAMFDRISELMRSQKAFLAQVSHELGSPLTRLNLALALARRKAGPELGPELGRLEYEARELNSLIQQLLLLARLESATEHDNLPQPFLISQLVSEVASDAQFEARQSAKSVALRLTDESLWRTREILGYRDLLKRALDNILRNAIRFTADGGQVEVECCTQTPGRVRLYVRDHGQGVPPEQVEAIFEPFVKIASKGNSSGVGLGLAIARQAVLTNGGTVHASNAEPNGLLITIDLPTISGRIPRHLASADQPGAKFTLSENQVKAM